MNAAGILEALKLPDGARVEQRVPKSLLAERGAPTAADKRYIASGIEELSCLATLKPTTVGVPACADEEREYLEIVVLKMNLRPGAKTRRLVEVVHRAVAYPAFLITENAGSVELSLAHKRWAQNEKDKVVLDGDVVATELDPDRDGAHWPAFRDALDVGCQPRAHLRALYQGWIDVALALQSSRVTGLFRLAQDPDAGTARYHALREIARLDAEIGKLRSAARKEKQMPRQVELNAQLKRREAERAAAKANL